MLKHNQNMVNPIDTINYSDELSQALIQSARRYIQTGDQYPLFEAELGWEEWMVQFCGEESVQDGGELTVHDIKNINKYLQEIWARAEQE